MSTNRSAAERRHHRERMIRNRAKLREQAGSWLPEHVGSLDKDRSMPSYTSKAPKVKGNYIAQGYTRPEWWDELPKGSTRQALKQELRKEVEAKR